MTTRTPEEARALILYAIAMTALAGIVLWCAYIVRNALLIVYVSGVLAIGFSPIVRVIERQRLGVREAAAALARDPDPVSSRSSARSRWSCSLMFPPLVGPGDGRSGTSSRRCSSAAQQFLISKGWLKEHLDDAARRSSARPARGGDAVGQGRAAAANVAGGIFGIVTILILTFYMLVDSWTLRESALRLFPRKHRARADAASRAGDGESQRVARRPVAARRRSIGATSAIGLWALGIPFFYVLALLSALGEMIPIVGPILAAIPAIAVASTVSLQKVLFVVIFFVVQQQLENHILVPKIMSRQVGVSPVTVIVALLIGGSLLGIVGALLAVPTAAILQVVATELLADESEK